MKKPIGKQRDLAKELFWRHKVAEQAQSGLSIQAYCQRHGLKYWCFKWWRQELVSRDAEVTATQTGETPNPSAERASTPGFLPVRVVNDVPVSVAMSSPIEIVLPAGPTVRVSRGFDPDALDAVLSVLEARRC